MKIQKLSQHKGREIHRRIPRLEMSRYPSPVSHLRPICLVKCSGHTNKITKLMIFGVENRMKYNRKNQMTKSRQCNKERKIQKSLK